MRDRTVTVHSWSKHCMRGRASWECWETLKIAGSNVSFFACLCKLLVTDLHLCWILKVLRYFTKSVMCLSGFDLFMEIQLCMNIPWLDYFNKLDETTEIGCNLYKSASHKNEWRAKLLNRTKNGTSAHMQERQPVGDKQSPKSMRSTCYYF